MRPPKANSKASVETLESLLLMSATIQGTAGADWIAGNDLDNQINAGAGDDAIHAPVGNNQIDGGSGEDTFVVYEGVSSQYSLQRLSNGSYELTGQGLHGITVNRLFNIERILFNDGAVELQPGSSAGSPSAPQSTAPVNNAGDGQSINGTSGDDWISGTEGNDRINAGAGNDAIHAPVGNNVIDGGTGLDSFVIYEGVRADYSIQSTAEGLRITGPGLNGQTVVNTLQNVEFVDFNDGRYTVGSPTEQQEAADQTPSPSEVPQANRGSGDGFGDNQTVESTQQPDPTPVQATAQQNVSVGAFELEVVRLTNIERANYGLPALTINATLTQVAESYSSTLANGDFFSHVGLDGRLPWDRVTDAGYDYRFVGENIAAGQQTPAQVVQAWLDSPSHRENILNPNYNEIGIGYVLLSNDFGNLNFNHYWTQLFGTQL